MNLSTPRDRLSCTSGIVTDEELAPFLEQARNASSVRWLAARIRIGALMASALKPAEQPAKRDSKGDSGKTPEPAVEPAVEPPKVAAQKAQKEDASSESRAPQAAIGNPSPQKPESVPVKADKNPTAKGKTNSERSDQAEPKRAA